MVKGKRGLGRGLGSLIADTSVTPSSPGLLMVDVDDIAPNPHQPRTQVDPEALQELADSIREHGLIQPLVVTRREGGDDDPLRPTYQLIAGERRWQACQLAEMEQVPVIVKEATEQQMLELALVENIQRADLNPLEEALAYRHLVDDFDLTQEQVAQRVGRSRVSVTNALRLLGLPAQIQSLLANGQLSAGHARALLALAKLTDQLAMAKAVIDKGLSVRQTEEAVRRLSAECKPPARRQRSPETAALEDTFRQALGTKVNLTRGRRGGKLTIYFYSEEELQTLYDILIEPSDQDLT